jgi:hypothetical protein
MGKFYKGHTMYVYSLKVYFGVEGKVNEGWWHESTFRKNSRGWYEGGGKVRDLSGLPWNNWVDWGAFPSGGINPGERSDLMEICTCSHNLWVPQMRCSSHLTMIFRNLL